MQSILDAKWQLFVKVAEVGTISGAALALDMPQSVVSRQIARLEEESGTRLFQRTGRGVVLSEFGQRIYPRIVAMIREAEELTDEMRSSSGTPMGDVRVGLLPSTVPILAGPLFARVKQCWPQVRLHLTEGSSAQLEELLLQGRLDLALLLREEDTARPDETVLSRLPLFLVVPKMHPLAARNTIKFDEVARLPLVLPSEPHPLRGRLALLARQKQLTFTQVLEADSIRLQHEIVACEGGFAITAGTLTQQDEHRLVAIRIVQPELSRSVILGVTQHRAHTRASWAVMGLLRQMAPEMLSTMN